MSPGATMSRSSPCDGNRLPIKSGFRRTIAVEPPRESRSVAIRPPTKPIETSCSGSVSPANEKPRVASSMRPSPKRYVPGPWRRGSSR